MMQRVELEPAYVLHRRPYSNTSWIVEFFTERHGRMAAIARSARGLKSRYRGRIELFLPMLISWSGRGELKTLGQVEFSSAPLLLNGNALLCGFYLNEILMRLLHRDDPYPQLFDIYQTVLHSLEASPELLQVALRCFEKKLLQELGYGLSLTEELHTGALIEPLGYYQFISDRGFVRCSSNENAAEVFLGSSLLALHHEQFNDARELNEAKRLMRLVLARHLGDRPIKSRDLLR